MAITTSRSKLGPGSAPQKSSSSKVGAPAQLNQSSRKGKKAWRKNVDLEDVDDKLEGLREEERQFGTKLQDRKDEDLFVIDKTGDDKVLKRLPKFSTRQLTAHKILSQRSAVPAVASRRPTEQNKTTVTRKEKERLLKLTRRDRKGPLNSVVDHDQVGEGSALLEVSNAVKQSGKYNVWEDSTVQGTSVKAPNVPHPRTQISVPAIVEPHAGTSYNPPVQAHTELLRAAHDVEERRVREAEALTAIKERISVARVSGEEGVAGMIVDDPDAVQDDEDDGEHEVDTGKPKTPGRKTKQQRRKALRVAAEKRALERRKLRKQLHASVDSAKRLSKLISADILARARLQEERSAKAQEKLRAGLAGQRFGKHRVPDSQMDVQLGEELSETLRELKPEGNLFKDRYVSMQHRALIEPRTAVLATKKRKVKYFERHDYKRFV